MFVIVFNKTIIPLALVGYEMIIANLAQRASLAIYHLISNSILGDPGAVSGAGDKVKTGGKKFDEQKVQTKNSFSFVLFARRIFSRPF